LTYVQGTARKLTSDKQQPTFSQSGRLASPVTHYAPQGRLIQPTARASPAMPASRRCRQV
jgi:hypothetical protein